MNPTHAFSFTDSPRPLWVAHAPHAAGHPLHGRHGHHSAWADAADNAKWVAFDLGGRKPLDAVVLHPLAPYYEEGFKEQWSVRGRYFPRALRVEVAGRSDFSDARIVAEWSDPARGRETDFDAQGNFLGWFDADDPIGPLRIVFPEVAARHVRIVATSLGGYYSSIRLRNNEPKRFALALSAVEIFHGSTDHAASAEVSVSGQLEGVARYAPRHLTRGYATPLPPATLFRREFELAEAPADATLEATAIGVYRATINGAPVSGDRFPPEWTTLDQRLLVQRYDVTALLKAGANAIAVAVGDGWPLGTLTGGILDGCAEGFYHQFAARLTLRFSDGRSQVWVTDDAWQTSAKGPWRQTDLYMGEVFDRRLLVDGWERSGFDCGDWPPAATRPMDAAPLFLQDHPGLRVAEEIACLSVSERAPGAYLLDFGVNLLGVVRLRLRGRPGHPIHLQHVQSLNADGSPHTFSLSATAQRDTVIPESDEPFTYEPTFTLHSFRYVEASGLSEKPAPDTAVALFIHSAADAAGKFECSSLLLDAIVAACDRTIRCNLISVSTDCAARERYGWAISEPGASATFFQRQAGPVFAKWLRDFADGFVELDAGTGAGSYPAFAPGGSPAKRKVEQARGVGKWFSFGWSDCPIVTAWQHWLHYADRAVLEENWPTLRRQALLLERIAPATLDEAPDIFTYFGDWLDANTLHDPIWTGSGYLPDPARQSDFAVDRSTFAYALLARDIDLSARIAELAGATEEAARWREKHALLKIYFTRHFFEDNGKAKCHSQGAYALALHHDLLPAERVAPALRWLDHAIALANHRFATGFQCTPLLLHVLSRHGRHAAACRLVLREQPGGYGHMIAKGATGIWERWDSDAWHGKAYMNDLSHRDFTSVADWVWQHVAGIQPLESAPGFSHVRIAPKFDGPLDHVRARHKSIRGELGVEWRRRGNEVTLEIVLPDGMAGVLEPEGGEAVPLQTGLSRHSLVFPTAD